MKLNQIVKSVKLPAKASVFYLGASVAGKLVSVATTPFFTRALKSEEYGQFAEYMSIVGAVTLICSALTSGSAVYKGLRDYGENKRIYLAAVSRVNLLLSLLICILLFTFSSFLGIKRHLLLPLTIQILCDGITSLALCYSKFNYKYKTVTAVTVINAILPPVISISILLTLGGGYLVRVYSLLAVSVLTALFLIFKVWHSGKTKREDIKYIMKNSLPMLPHGLSNALAIQADKLILSAVMGTVALAKYSVVYSLGIAIQFTVAAIGSALTPWIIRRLDAGEEGRIRELVFPMFIGYCALSLCLIAIGPEALLILAPKDYLDAFPALAPISLSTPFLFISFVSNVGLVYSGKGWYSAIISLVCSVICVVLNFKLIDLYSYFGAGISTLVYHFLSAALSVFLLSKSKLGYMMYRRKMLVPCLISGTLGVLLFLLKDFIFARGVMLIFPGVMLLYCLFKAKELVMEKTGKIIS